MSRVDILLATYNGATYLPEQLASIEGQTHKDWRLLVRDDGSSDTTLDIVRDWASGVSQPVEIMEDGRNGLGASLNFAALMEHSSSDYFACCDQDDFWLPHKVETMLRSVQEAEQKRSAQTPVLAYSDLLVVDEKLDEIAPSYWEISNLDPDRDRQRLADIMVRNVATGCATMGNAALLRKALPIPSGARMHDWWLAMAAFKLGDLVPVREALIKYRQHGKNTIGANKSTTPELLKQFAAGPGIAWQRTVNVLDRSQKQAAAFVERFGDIMTQEERDILSQYSRLPDMGVLERKAFLMRHRIGGHQPLFRLALLAVA